MTFMCTPKKSNTFKFINDKNTIKSVLVESKLIYVIRLKVVRLRRGARKRADIFIIVFKMLFKIVAKQSKTSSVL